MSDEELMGRNEYARHKGVAPNAVAKAIDSGRIAKAVVRSGGRFKGIKWRVADAEWLKNTDPVQAERSRKPVSPAPVQTSGLSQEERLQAVLGRAIAKGFVGWAGMLMRRFNLTAELAADALSDLHLCQAVALSEQFGGDIEASEALLTGDCEAALSPEARPALIERIRLAAEAFGETSA